MQATPEVLSLVAFGISLLNSIALLWLFLSPSRQSPESLRSDVDELAVTLERLSKAHNRERMSRVRAAQKLAEDPEALVAAQAPADYPATPQNRKAALRQRLRGGH